MKQTSEIATIHQQILSFHSPADAGTSTECALHPWGRVLSPQHQNKSTGTCASDFAGTSSNKPGNVQQGIGGGGDIRYGTATNIAPFHTAICP